MPQLNYSETLVAQTAENVDDLNTILAEIRAVVNALDNDNVANGAAIDYSKLALSGSIVNADVAAAAAIAHTKLATITQGRVLAGGGSNVPTVRSLIDLISSLGTLGAINGLAVNLQRDNSTYTSLDVTTVPPAGQHLCVGWSQFDEGTTSGLVSSTLRIRSGFNEIASDFFGSQGGVYNTRSAICAGVYEFNGGESAVLDAVVSAVSGTAVANPVHGLVCLPVGTIANL